MGGSTNYCGKHLLAVLANEAWEHPLAVSANEVRESPLAKLANGCGKVIPKKEICAECVKSHVENQRKSGKIYTVGNCPNPFVTCKGRMVA